MPSGADAAVLRHSGLYLLDVACVAGDGDVGAAQERPNEPTDPESYIRELVK